jgi:hypothetical protein
VTVSASVKNVWTFTWTYTVAPDPAKPSPVPALTAWTLFNSTGGGTAPVALGATIASESVVVSSQFPTGKYSFSLAPTTAPGVPDQTQSRVSPLTWTITDASSNIVFGPQSDTATVVDNVPGSAAYAGPPALDFTYTANGGTFGDASYALLDSAAGLSVYGMPPATAASDQVPGDARSILNGGVGTTAYHDIFKGNDDGGADGSALSDAVAGGVTANLGPGSYTVTLSGTVKDNTTNFQQPFSVSQTVHIITPGCGASP